MLDFNLEKFLREAQQKKKETKKYYFPKGTLYNTKNKKQLYKKAKKDNSKLIKIQILKIILLSSVLLALLIGLGLLIARYFQVIF